MNTRDMIFKRFFIVWIGQLMSAIGSGLTAFALGVYIFQETQSAVSYSFVIFSLFFHLLFYSLLPEFWRIDLTGKS
jgi:uncharacterized membrane protein